MLVINVPSFRPSKSFYFILLQEEAMGGEIWGPELSNKLSLCSLEKSKLNIFKSGHHPLSNMANIIALQDMVNKVTM